MALNLIKKLFLFALISLIITFILAGCEQAPSETVNNYYVNTDSLTNPNAKLRIIFTNPSQGEVGPFEESLAPQITIQFNKLINRMNILSGKIIIATQGEVYKFRATDYSFIGENENFANIIILNTSLIKYKAGKTYTVTIDTTLIDIHGYSLSDPYSFSFIPEPKFRLLSTPSEYSSDPEDVREIYLTFNSKIDPSFFNKISISPNLKGSWGYPSYTWSDHDSMSIIYRLEDICSYDTKYLINITPGAADVNGMVISNPTGHFFTTSPFTVELSSFGSSMGPNGFYIPQDINFVFNGSVDTSTVRSSIKIEPAVDFELEFYGNSSTRGLNVMRLNMYSRQLLRNTVYKITLNKTIRAANGAYMKEPHSYTFATGF